jgi:hypothetical protein
MRFEDFEHFLVYTNFEPAVLAHAKPCNTTIDQEVGNGTSVATLMRVADQHRRFCEYGFSETEATADANARWETVWLSYPDERGGFAFLTRQKGTELWDVNFCSETHDVRLSGEGVGYERGLALIFEAMGELLPQDFVVSRE